MQEAGAVQSESGESRVSRRSQGGIAQWVGRILRQPAGLVGFVVVFVVVVLAFVGPALAPFDPELAISGNQYRPPSG